MKQKLAKIFFILLASGLLFSVTACKKCRECTVYEKSDLSLIYYYESHCSTGSHASTEINDWESELRSKYAGYYIYCNAIN